jgi:hypothetical protein
MPFLYTAIHIKAEPSKVWSALTDFPRYAEWNPLLRSVQGELHPGARIRLLIKLPWLPHFSILAVIQRVEPGMNFDWAGDVLSSSIFRGHHRFTVVSGGNGDTHFEQAEEYSGLLNPMAFLLIPILRVGFEQMNRSLKSFVEQPPSSRRQPESGTEKIKNT